MWPLSRYDNWRRKRTYWGPVAEEAAEEKGEDELGPGECNEITCRAELSEPERLPCFDFDQFANEVRDRRFNSAIVLGTLTAALGRGTRPKTPA